MLTEVYLALIPLSSMVVNALQHLGKPISGSNYDRNLRNVDWMGPLTFVLQVVF